MKLRHHAAAAFHPSAFYCTGEVSDKRTDRVQPAHSWGNLRGMQRDQFCHGATSSFVMRLQPEFAEVQLSGVAQGPALY